MCFSFIFLVACQNNKTDKDNNKIQQNISVEINQNSSVLIFAQEKALEYLLDKIKTLECKLDGNAILLEHEGQWDNNKKAWYFALGINPEEKFTAENHFAVTENGDIFKLDILSNEWNLL